MEWDHNLIAAIASAVSALGSLVVAVIMVWQTNMFRNQNRDEISRLAEAQERENKISEVQNKILINKMINDLNKLVISGDELMRTEVGNRMFNVDANLARRIYL